MGEVGDVRFLDGGAGWASDSESEAGVGDKDELDPLVVPCPCSCPLCCSPDSNARFFPFPFLSNIPSISHLHTLHQKYYPHTENALVQRRRGAVGHFFMCGGY